MNHLTVLADNISQESGVTIGLAVIVVSCAVWIVTRISKIDSRLKTLEDEHYTKAEAEAHALRLALENPQMNVPDPRNPGQLLRPRHEPESP